MRILFSFFYLFALALVSTMAHAAPRELPRMENPSLSPDGRYVAYLARDAANQVALEVIDLDGDDARRRVIDASAFEGQTLDWWGWGNSERLLCGLHLGGRSTVLAVNVDGGDRRVLLRHEQRGDDPDLRPQVIDWLPREPKSVLLRLQAQGEAFPSVQQLDVLDGALRIRLAAQPPIRHFRTDNFGEVRFGWGAEPDGTIAAFSRLGEAKLWRPLKWKRLTRFHPPPGVPALQPMPVHVTVADHLTALGRRGAHDAMFSLDLSDQEDPHLSVFADGSHAMQPIVSPRGTLIGLELSGGERPVIWFDNRSQNVAERVGAELGGAQVRVIDFVDNPSRFLVRARRGNEPTRLYLYGMAGGPFELRQIGRLDGAPLKAAPAAAAAPSSAPGGDTLDLLITVIDHATKKPVAGLPMRVVLSSDPQWQRPDAGTRYVTDDRGRVRDSRPVRMEKKRVGLDIPLVTHAAVGFDIGVEVEIKQGMPLLYTLTLDEVKKAHGTLISNTQVYTRGADGGFTRKVDLGWNATNNENGDVYTLPPRDAKTFDRLPDPPPFRITERNLQLLPHAKADGTTRWALDLRLTWDPYKPRPGG